MSSLVYTKSGSGYTLESAVFGEGRIQVSGSTVIPHYQVTDHLGSVRVVFTNKTANGVTARNDYYAYGKRHTNSNLSIGSETTNRYLFNGKEAQTTGELGLLDFGARMYSGEFVRWWSVDPLADARLSVSPFAFCQSNPVNRIDPTGMLDDWYVDENGADPIWRESKKAQITENGKTYTNVGANMSLQNDDGSFSNYYQNVGYRSAEQFTAGEYILNNNLAPELMSRNSGLWEQGKQDLMGDVVRQRSDFLVGATLIGSKMLQKAGDGFSTVGHAANASGLGAEAGVPLVILLGSAMKYTGVGIELAVDYKRGNINKMGYTTTTNGLMYGVGAFGNLSPAGPVFNLMLVPFNQLMDYGGSQMAPSQQKK